MLERQTQMTNKHPHPPMQILQFIADADDAPVQARHDSRMALDALDASNKVRNHERLAAHQALQTLQTNNSATVSQVVDQLRTGAPTDLATDAQKVEQLQRQLATAQQRAFIADSAHRSIANQIDRGTIIDKHQATLLQWIAQRRNAHPFDCGLTTTMPRLLTRIYERVSPNWYAHWQQPLDLEQMVCLPLIYNPEWTSQRRASLAWVWEQLALGLVQWTPQVPNPMDAPRGKPARDTGLRFHVLMPVNKPTTLPKVPAVPPVPLSN